MVWVTVQEKDYQTCINLLCAKWQHLLGSCTTYLGSFLCGGGRQVFSHTCLIPPIPGLPWGGLLLRVYCACSILLINSYINIPMFGWPQLILHAILIGSSRIISFVSAKLLFSGHTGFSIIEIRLFALLKLPPPLFGWPCCPAIECVSVLLFENTIKALMPGKFGLYGRCGL